MTVVLPQERTARSPSEASSRIRKTRAIAFCNGSLAIHYIAMQRQFFRRALVAATAIALNSHFALPARANCNDRVSKLAYIDPAMTRLWSQLQNRQTYPWGSARVYDRREGNTIHLAAAFDRLSGPQKKQAIALLQLDYSDRLSDLLTAAERQQPGIGAIPPYRVLTSDGRLVRTAYDGCTSVVLLTEFERFDYYYTRRPRTGDRQVTVPELRNGGNPFWREVRFPLAPEREAELRHRFWRAIGYDRAETGYWIAWVPERGAFEIVMPTGSDPAVLERFWSVTPGRYRYEVLNAVGTVLFER